MDILFLHQNFPGQFLSLAPALVRAGHRVYALTARAGLPETWRGVRVIRYKWEPPDNFRTHLWTSQFNLGVTRGEVVFRASMALNRKGLRPDVIVAHTGWGEALYLRDVWPDARLAAFSELWYLAEGGDLGFDPEFPVRDPQGLHPYVRMKNALQSMQIETADALFSSTRWQASTYPDSVSDRMHVLHEGVDTRRSKPDETAELVLGDGRSLTRSDKVISFVNRNLEPHRGFHVFMRALPALLTDDPDLHVVIVGGDGVSYGRSPKEGGTWKEVLLNEVSKDLPEDWEARVHFTGLLKHDQLTRLFQIARTHVYLTYPFVPSWSLLEAMSCGTPVIANNVAPVAEFVSHGETGFLIDLFDQEALVEAIRHVLSAPEDVAFLGDAARVMIKNHYDLDTVCLPRRIQFVEGLMDQSLSSAIRS